LYTTSIIRNSLKSLIDTIDEAVAPHYGFTNEEVDFITNFDV
jgi:hypothetical protein